MGILRESCDPNELSPMLFGVDLPVNSDILLDDINEYITIRKSPLVATDYGLSLDFTRYALFTDHYTYDECDQLRQAGLKGMRTGKELRNSFIEMIKGKQNVK